MADVKAFENHIRRDISFKAGQGGSAISLSIGPRIKLRASDPNMGARVATG